MYFYRVLLVSIVKNINAYFFQENFTNNFKKGKYLLGYS